MTDIINDHWTADSGIDIDANDRYSILVYNINDNIICTVYGHSAEQVTERSNIIASVPELLEIKDALQKIIDIGKRDMSNPKYDGYFNTAENALKAYKEKTE